MKSSSKRWLKRHVRDPFVHAAKREGYASRAAFKLLGIQQKDLIFKSGMVVLDLGAAPGGWSQVARECVGKKGRVIAIDLFPVLPIPEVTVIQGDLNDPAIMNELIQILHDQPIDVILSDMAPNLSGQSSIDMPRSIHLVELALDCAEKTLRPGGTLLFKAFQGAGLDTFIQSVKTRFSQVKYRKPEASRSESNEIYVLALGFR